MEISINNLTADELAVYKLRNLYEKYGYSKYKMGKFEEYDFYSNNKDFLISDNIITFTDTNGKLMALKPDVTLSIIKNIKHENSLDLKKLFYCENVYRVSGVDRRFKEIMQVGLEAVGKIDVYTICEVLTLAVESLRSVSESCILEISDVGILYDIVCGMGIKENDIHDLFEEISRKNISAVIGRLKNYNVDQKYIDSFEKLVTAFEDPVSALEILKNEFTGLVDSERLEEFRKIVEAMDSNDLGDYIRIDFSLINDIRFYDGIIFKGYIENIPVSVLSGGQYSKLLKKFGLNAGAIGFAFYTDALERVNINQRKYDVDTLVLYDNETSPEKVISTVHKQQFGNNTVMAVTEIPKDMRYKEIKDIRGSI